MCFIKFLWNHQILGLQLKEFFQRTLKIAQAGHTGSNVSLGRDSSDPVGSALAQKMRCGRKQCDFSIFGHLDKMKKICPVA